MEFYSIKKGMSKVKVKLNQIWIRIKILAKVERGLDEEIPKFEKKKRN